MKEIVFVGHSLDHIKSFPNSAKREAGFQLDIVQHGENPANWKPMPSIGSGVQEIRISEAEGIYRIIYLAKIKDAVFVLHAFQKKSQKISKPDIEIAKNAYKQVMEEYKS